MKPSFRGVFPHKVCRSRFGLVLGVIWGSISLFACGDEVTPSLKEAASEFFHLGVGTDSGVIDRAEDSALLVRQFGFLTPENCLKMTSVQPKEGAFDFEKADALVSFAESQGITVVGHTLVWSRPGTTPGWFFESGDGGDATAEVVLSRMREHILTVVGRYKGRIKEWDVVNEALADSDEEYLRDIEWSRLLGEEFIVKAFQYAREADPDALLIYNDYRCDHPGKLKKLVRLIKSLREKGAPIDAVGFQGHYEFGMIPYEGIDNALRAMRELGVKVVFSELDMDVVTRAKWYADDGAHREEVMKFDPYRDGCPAEILEGQALQYSRLFSLFADNAGVIHRVSFWNLHDGQSWLNYWPWNRTNHPLLFDRHRAPKPAFDSVIEALRSEK